MKRVFEFSEEQFIECDLDPLFLEVCEMLLDFENVSSSFLLRKFKIGFHRADLIIEQLETIGIIENSGDVKYKRVLINNVKEVEQLLTFNSHKLISFNQRKEKERLERVEKEKENKIRQRILKQQEQKKLRKKVIQSLIDEGLIHNNIGSRKPIPQEVKDIVWNRDGGQCVECGSKEDLEFDHIIPHSKGGSDSARNLQLLCENCNRKKSNKIG